MSAPPEPGDDLAPLARDLMALDRMREYLSAEEWVVALTHMTNRLRRHLEVEREVVEGPRS